MYDIKHYEKEIGGNLHLIVPQGDMLEIFEQVKLIQKEEYRNRLHLLEFKQKIEGDDVVYQYFLGDRISLDKFAGKSNLKKSDMFIVLLTVANTISNGEKYGFSEASFIIDKDFIYISEADVLLTYLPVTIEVDAKAEFKRLVKFVSEKLREGKEELSKINKLMANDFSFKQIADELAKHVNVSVTEEVSDENDSAENNIGIVNTNQKSNDQAAEAVNNQVTYNLGGFGYNWSGTASINTNSNTQNTQNTQNANAVGISSNEDEKVKSESGNKISLLDFIKKLIKRKEKPEKPEKPKKPEKLKKPKKPKKPKKNEKECEAVGSASEAAVQYDGGEATVLLNFSPDSVGKTVLKAYLIPLDPAEKAEAREVAVLNYPFTIGRGKTLTVTDMAFLIPKISISRKHAEIHSDGVYFWIMDIGTNGEGSTGGTFVNNVRISPNLKTPIKDGDKLRFFESEYVFSVKQI